MFGRFRKNESDEKVVSDDVAGSLPADFDSQGASLSQAGEELAEAIKEVGKAEPASVSGAVDDQTQEEVEQARSQSEAGEGLSASPASREAEVLQDLLAKFAAYGQSRDIDDHEDFVGLSVECGELASDDEEESRDAATELPPAEATAAEEFSESEATAIEELPEAEPTDEPLRLEAMDQGKPRLSGRRKTGRRLASPGESGKPIVTPEQRLLLLDTWRRSGLSAKDFAALVGVSKHTLYKWKQRFSDLGPAGLMDQPRQSRRGSQLPELTKRAILMMKEANPDWGCQRISDMLSRGPALPASASAVARVLKEAGYESVPESPRRHPQRVRRFERARPNQLWQTDLFTFVLKRQNRRLYLAAFLDDHSRFIVSFGLTASATTAQVIEILEAGIASYGVPEEVLTDNGPQYVTWRGKSRFSKQLEKRGIRQLIARPKRPQTLGKIERFWGTLWREFLEAAIFTDLEDARRRIGHFIDYYNFSRVHRGIDGLVPADRFFQAAPEVLQTLKERVSANALQLARHGETKKPFYVTGQVDGQSFSVHSEGERLILRRQGQQREEVELTSPAPPEEGAPHSPVEPLCADGSLPAAAGEPADCPPPLPGQSVIGLEADNGDQPRSGKGGEA